MLKNKAKTTLQGRGLTALYNSHDKIKKKISTKISVDYRETRKFQAEAKFPLPNFLVYCTLLFTKFHFKSVFLRDFTTIRAHSIFARNQLLRDAYPNRVKRGRRYYVLGRVHM